MFELIATIILIGSLAGIAAILHKKIPLLLGLPEAVEAPKKESIFLRVKKTVKDILPTKLTLLHKILCWVKILTLKIETRIDKLLHKVRKKVQKEKEEKINGAAKEQTQEVLKPEQPKNIEPPKNLPIDNNENSLPE